MSIKLSILTPHITDYNVYLERLRPMIDNQCNGEIEWIVWEDQRQASVGIKRNWLLDKARGEYLCFIDSDDMVSHDYIAKIMEGISKGVDCCSLTGEITDDGKNPRKFIHSIRYDRWFEKDGVYYRSPNHLNTIKASIAKQIPFPYKNVGEDHEWSTRLQKSGLVKTEHWIEGTIYYYLHRSK